MGKSKESKEVVIELRVGSEKRNQISGTESRRLLDRLTQPYREVLEAQRLMFEEFTRTLGELSAFHKEYAHILAKYGWYINAGMMLETVHKVLHAAGEDRSLDVDKLMMGYYRGSFETIQKRLIAKHANRATILDEGFRAHSLQMYHSATLIFLAQSDGLCGGKLMRPGRIQEFLETQNSASIVETVLGQPSAINDHIHNKSNYSSALNRHEVMHGYSTDFGSELNSLKALSLLSFVSDMVGRHNKR